MKNGNIAAIRVLVAGMAFTGVLCGLALWPSSPTAAQNAADAGFKTLDLKGLVNMDWKDEKVGDGKGGFTDQGSANDLRNAPVGMQKFFGIPFELIDPAKNNSKAVLTLKSQNFPAGVPSASVDVGGKAKSIYFLHAAAWNDGTMANYIVNYDDGSKIEIPIRADQEITNWWGPKHGKGYRTAFNVPNNSTDNVGMVIFGWDNPNSDKAVKSIEFRTTNAKGVVVIAAVTLSDKPVNLTDPKDIPVPEYLQSDTSTLDKSQWWALESKLDKFEPTIIDQSATLEAPAGKHGFMKNLNGKFVFEDGTPVKEVACVFDPWNPKDKEKAEYQARWLAKFGFNMVRFHALWDRITDDTKPDSGTLDPAKMDMIDYFIAELAKRGIYTRLSMLYYRTARKGDGLDGFDQAVKVESEGMKDAKEKEKYLQNPTMKTTGITFFDEKAQKLNIDLEKAIMTHRNPYRDNKMYGEDPAICQIEVTNEDGMFFFTIDAIPPFYKQELNKLWNDWLRKKYGSQEKLAEAWGKDMWEYETLEMGTVKRMYMYEFNSLIPKERIPRATDQLRFYFELNNGYFTKTKRALRAAGAKQPINGTCWFGPTYAYWAEMYSNVPNMDFIDRHHYWGGGPGGWQILSGMCFEYKSAIQNPELILKLSAERIMDMPYTISEWTNTLPNQWRAETVPLMTFYGQCLNGWDAPIHFALDMRYSKGFVEHIKWMWPVNDPIILCQYPACSRIIFDGDIKEGEIAFVRNVSEKQTFSAEPIKDAAVTFAISGIYEQSSSAGVSEKSLASMYAAAVGKAGIMFNKEDKPDIAPDISKFVDTKKKEIRSNTGELYWNYGVGYITADTPRTQAACGFLKDVPVSLADCQVGTDNTFASIIIRSWDGKPIKESKQILITAVARTRNADMAYTRGGQRLIDRGEKGPVMVEGVRGTVMLKRSGKCTVTPLDPYGYPTDAKVEPKIEDGKITIPMDGKNKAVYYEVKFE
ncbi:MAG: beta-galactosidase [Planctomycetes bacterium]|nr:beta-galactosidase [Planctomycetota bacterium]